MDVPFTVGMVMNIQNLNAKNINQQEVYEWLKSYGITEIDYEVWVRENPSVSHVLVDLIKFIDANISTHEVCL
jgi:hypothetical protein